MDSISCPLEHNQTRYTLSIWHNALGESSPTEQSLHLVLRHTDSHQLSSWTGTFTGAYVEEMTRKTGNYKRFPVFVEMLVTGIKQANPTVSLDLLTHDDLLALKKTSSKASKSTINQHHQMRLYLILTYAVAFDRVHYPLPLLMNEQEPAASLRAEIQELKNEKTLHLQEIQRLLKENDRLKLELKRLASSRSGSSRISPPKIYAKPLKRKVHHESSFEFYDRNEPLEKPDITDALLKKDREIERLKLDLMKARSTNLSANRRPSPAPRGTIPRAPEPYKLIRSRPLYSAVPTRSASAGAIPAGARERIHSGSRTSRSPSPRFNPTQYVLEKEQKLREIRARSQDRFDRRSSTSSSISLLKSPPTSQERGRPRTAAPIPPLLSNRKATSIGRKPQKRRGRATSPAPSYAGSTKDNNSEIDKRLETLRNFLNTISIS
ncbi:hypothetical protein SeLEV6574_g06295 [Synchytrium endobioticum]|uniref:Coiled-coil domain-containing protein 61 n=1 Tax=Synchytrium endobioticum TaxID=286115 RepID=A0A507CPD8_9FUNG|nr:hypothetical protein SeLEV6574_g06295 [Synchytrium endobioticum]